jgi:hypothetical protein
MNTLDTTGWNEFPFVVDGINYVSKISPDSPFLETIKKLPYGRFETMNIEAVRDLIGAGLTRAEIVQKIEEVNKYATHAVIELG